MLRCATYILIISLIYACETQKRIDATEIEEEQETFENIPLLSDSVYRSGQTEISVKSPEKITQDTQKERINEKHEKEIREIVDPAIADTIIAINRQFKRLR